MGTVRFGNDQFAPILGYGDLVQGNITINRVYYVKGLNHNLFSVGQFYDADLEVAFRKSTLSKAKRSSFKKKAVPSSKGWLILLHMDLCAPMPVASINGKKYILDSSIKLTDFLDSDHARCLVTRKSSSGGIQFLGDKLVSWMLKKQDCSAMSSAEAEYMELSASCAQVMWMRTQLKDYGFNYNKIPLYCDSQSAIAISCNPVHHSRTKHIHTGYHFIKERVEHGIIELYFVRTEYQLADIFTKALPEDRFQYLVRRIGISCLTLAELEVLANKSMIIAF
ncbi:hypothetical protein Tco_1526059 [Tanacetum coccineum]